MNGDLNERARVRVDRSDELDRYRFTCPNGHTTWERTNSHAWCKVCAKASDQGDDVDPEFYEIYDKRADQLIPYEQIEFAGPDEGSHKRFGGRGGSR